MNTLSFTLPIVSVLAIVAARFIEIGTKRNVIAGKVTENLTFQLFMFTGTAMLVLSLIEYIAKGSQLWCPTFIAGWACALTSFALRRRAIAALGRFWSLHVEIRDNHEFVQSGPFRFMRHPAYFSMVLELLSLALILNAFWALVLIPLCFVPVLIKRIRIEEAALIEKFGPAYQQYQQSTPALFPIKW